MMTAWILLSVVYLWGGLTLLMALEQMEAIAGVLNEISGPLALKPMGQFIRGRFGVRAVIVAGWPVWAFIWWSARKTHNVRAKAETAAAAQNVEDEQLPSAAVGSRP